MTNKKTAVFGLYPSVERAERAVDELVTARFDNADVSVLMADQQGSKDFAHENESIRKSSGAIFIGVVVVLGCAGAAGAQPNPVSPRAQDAVISQATRAGEADVDRTVEPTPPATVGTMQSPQAQVTDPDAFRHRFSISGLWGVDNQFSGKVIEAASGQTTTGVPINLDETTYDELYGRMGLFKIGVGYRTSPRAEAVVNLVISRSGSERVNVGTVGTANIPLLVDFDAYNYWGFEGGQRFYFARVRFTPYAGYLVGINRYDDIRGTFVNVPANLTPGLAAQDGKFFEKSWAFSLGPTGGVLVGLGPIEVMGEVQLRYMGGLSDVDWLVEEGLRDINSESSRWSFPILIGARFRF
jgi:hypothetical protein